jgi:NitT/TauT family transport system substrate-binding protein
MVQASEKPRDAVEFAYDFLTRNCIWTVNAGFNRERVEWTVANDVANGDIDPAKKPTFEQVVDVDFTKDALAAAGGPVTIGNCTE